MNILTFLLISFVALHSNSDNLLPINNKKENISIYEIKNNETNIVELLSDQDHQQFVLKLPYGTVINEGGILTKEGYILKDTQTSLRDQHGLQKENRDINNENPLFFKGRLAVISSPGSENWYHWLLQVLPRIFILHTSKISYDRIYINNMKYPWQLSSIKMVLSALNINEEILFVLNGDCIIQASTLIIPSVPFIPCKGTPLPNWLATFLRHIFLTKTAHHNIKKYPDKIYISRKHASTRKINNENELITELLKYGFEVIYLEKLSPQEQAHIFNNARIIIGPHGSGFANLIFTEPGYTLIEIDHYTDPPRSFYKKLTALTSGNYYPLYVSYDTEMNCDSDLEIDISKCMQLIEKLSHAK